MPLYRKHRGSLDDSLKTTVIVKNWHDLRDIIYEDWEQWEDSLRKDGLPFNKNSFDIKIEPYMGKLDPRCGWYTQMVSCDLMEKGKYMAIGFLSEPMLESKDVL